MDTMLAFYKAKIAEAMGCDQMIFDWIEAAKLIKEKKPFVARAGLEDDFEYTAGIIYQNNGIFEDDYTYLSSNHATPILELDGIDYECYILEKNNVNNWDGHSKWPPEAKEILKEK